MITTLGEQVTEQLLQGIVRDHVLPSAIHRTDCVQNVRIDGGVIRADIVLPMPELVVRVVPPAPVLAGCPDDEL